VAKNGIRRVVLPFRHRLSIKAKYSSVTAGNVLPVATTDKYTEKGLTTSSEMRKNMPNLFPPWLSDDVCGLTKSL
jgi:hypothetical protein